MPEPFEMSTLTPGRVYRPVSPLPMPAPPGANKRRLPAWRQAWQDLRTARWSSFGVCVLWFFLLASPLVLLLVLLIFTVGFTPPRHLDVHGPLH